MLRTNIPTNPSMRKLIETETLTIIKLEMEETENLVQVRYKSGEFFIIYFSFPRFQTQNNPERHSRNRKN